MTTNEAVKRKEHIQRERSDVDVNARSMIGTNGCKKWVAWGEHRQTGNMAAVFDLNRWMQLLT